MPKEDVHAYSIQRISAFLGLNQKFDNALDVACGTGLSTRALAQIAKKVEGIDASREMLRLAQEDSSIRYTEAPAEKMPFGDDLFDLVTVASGVHWFDIDAFLKEVFRILKPGSWLVLYENYFDPAIQPPGLFAAWCAGYYRLFPSPARSNKYDWKDENLRPGGLRFVKELRSTYSIPMTRSQLALYFTTQSNVIARIENGERTFEEVEDWLVQELTPFFANSGDQRQIFFGNWIKFIQKPA
jgi:ubiquinone/menaquinone biosynthesis C-methylase UbiE